MRWPVFLIHAFHHRPRVGVQMLPKVRGHIDPSPGSRGRALLGLVDFAIMGLSHEGPRVKSLNRRVRIDVGNVDEVGKRVWRNVWDRWGMVMAEDIGLVSLPEPVLGLQFCIQVGCRGCK